MDAMFAIKRFERAIEQTRTLLTPERFEGLSAVFVKLGHVMLVATAALAPVFWTIAAIRQSSGLYVFYGLGYSLLFLVLQFTAHRCMDAGRTLLASSSNRLSSRAFLDCLALLFAVAGIMIFLEHLTYRQWNYFWTGLGLWILCDLLAYVALNPTLAGIIIAPGTNASEEAISIISFLPRALLRLVPLLFGTGVTLFFFALVSGTCGLLRRGGNEFDGKTALNQAALCACLPFAGYIIFAVYHLTIDILRAILVIPLKLDQMRDKSKTGE